MIRITPQHIYALRNSTGKPFTDLLDRLIRSSAAIVGIPASEVLDNPRINYPDGGVDTQVNKGAQGGPWDYFKGPSTWQYKAVELEELTDGKVQNEISGKSKEYARSLLKNGYAYRLCIAHDGPAEKKTSIKALLDAEIKNINLDAPESIGSFRLGHRRMGKCIPRHGGRDSGFILDGVLSLRDLAKPGALADHNLR